MLVVMLVLGMSTSLAVTDEPQTPASKIELTDVQKNELASLHKGIMDKKKELISKYVEYGVITEDKGKMMINRFEERYKKLEQNGFMPNCNKKKDNSKHE